MAINKNKVMEAAQKFVEKGQLDKAIKEYSKIVEEDQKDVRVWLKLGDLYAKKGAKQEATDTYLRVAQFYSDQGFYLKAVAVYKQVLKLDPRLIEVNIRLAEVYRQLGLLSDAMQQYELVAAFYHREGKTREALATIRELVEIDPENVATRIKLAELYSKEQLVKEAIAEFAKAADFLRAHGRMDDFIKVAERLVWHQPENHALNRELAGLYLKRHDPRHALQKLQACFKADARDVETLSLLASAFLALDQKQKTVSVWKELARVLAENRQSAQAIEVHRRILSLVPDDPDSLAVVGGRQAVGTGSTRALGPSLPVRPVPPGASPIGSEPGERMTGPRKSITSNAVRGVPMPSMEAAPLVSMRGATERATPVMNAPLPVATPVPPPSAAMYGRATATEPTIEDSGDAVAIEVDDASDYTAQNRPGGDATAMASIDAELELDRHAAGDGADSEEQVAKLLGEADVYIKYGIRDRAILHLGKIIDVDPRNLDAHERLKDVYLALDRKAEAALELVQLIEIVAPAGVELADTYLTELATLDPEAADALAHRLRAPGSDDSREMSSSAGPVSIDSVDVILEPPSVDRNAVVLPDLDGEGTEVRDEFPGIVTDAAAGGGEIEVSDDQLEGEEPELQARGAGVEDELHPELAFDEMVSTAASGEQTYDISVEAQSLETSPASGLGEASPASGRGEASPASGRGEASPASGQGEASPAHPQVELEAGVGSEAELSEKDYAIDPGDDAIEESIGVELEPDDGKAGPLEDDLDEADFFVSQGLVEEARTILSDLLGKHPGHAAIVAKLRALDGRQGVVIPPTERPSQKLASAAEAAPAPERRRRVIAKPLGETDADTHYDLGLAYKEMGLLEEAIKEFELVRDTQGHAVQCHLMIGLCHVQRGKLQEAVEEFKNGLYVDGINDREALALYFELGVAYEGLGDAPEALYYYEKVQKRDARFRHVGRRIDALQTVVGGSGAANGGRREARAGAPDGSSDDERAVDSALGENEV